MAELALVRIDARMIHGQVVTQWIKRLSCTRIIMVDDQFSADPFMSKVLVMAAPPGVKFDLISTKQAGEQWQKDQFGSVGPIMVIFKNVVTMAWAAALAVSTFTDRSRWMRPMLNS